MSCNAALNGDRSPAALIHQALPMTTVLAPDKPTASTLLLDSNGRFNGLKFDKASCIAFKPGEKSWVEISKPQTFDSDYQNIKYWFVAIGVFTGVIRGYLSLRKTFPKRQKPKNIPSVGQP